ncbi:MAG: Ku protein [Gemmatimonadales bacterium]|nr:Ku protein [Gemmatimonadales bacterium]
MAARSIGSATISFGLVSVPVNLFSSSESSAAVSFNMLHSKCGSRLKQQYVCAQEGSVVEKDEVTKGYEFAKGQYVRFSADEIKALDEKATNTIDIAEFVPLAAVDRIYLEKVYYLGAGKGGERAYRLLVAALHDTGRAALGQYSARGKQYLALIRPMGDILVMEQLHYHGELRSADEVPRPDVVIKDAELALARQLIEQGSVETFTPQNFRDTVRERVLQAIQQKVDGQEITSEPADAPQTKIIDLMDALKASLAKRGASTAEKMPARHAAAKSAEKAAAPRPRKKASGAR